MDEISPCQFPSALAHGPIKQIFNDVFFVSGAMETVLMDMDWQFSRNMTIVRDGGRLILINSIRLNEQALSELEQLGEITDVIRLGALHGRDDAFYVDRYKAKFWAPAGVSNDTGLVMNELSPSANLPIEDASVFIFETTQIPEAILFLQREGGIAIACDALQNWLAPDEHFCDASVERMQPMGFFTPANIGPVWQQAAAPEAADFVRLQQEPFKHALCGHGEPLLNTAKEDYLATFRRVFNIA